LSYQVIARKWRPQSFDEVSGQAHVTKALRNAIRTDRIPHAMLLTGPRGVGKTTLARLIARCLNCEKGPTDQPCGSCAPCSEITEGRSTDVQEIDAASRTGVDDMREVIESIRYAAAPGKYRIFIVDEVHMLSGPAFNALLKTLEEPPPRSLFVFATTNPEKIPFTVLSRCQRHDLRRIALTSVGERLAEICASEGIRISAGAIASIAREGDGSMRDAQTLLDQIVAYRGGEEDEITDDVVAEVLDLVDRRVLRAIVEACIDADPRSALEQTHRATSGGSEARRVADALLELLRDLVVLRVAPDGEGLFEGPDEERAELIELASRTEPARLRRMFRALVREIEDLSWAPQPKAVLEMAVIRLATMPTGDDVGQLLGRLDQLERRLAGGSSGGGRAGGTRVSDRQPRRRTPQTGPSPSSGPRSGPERTGEPEPDGSPPVAASAPSVVPSPPVKAVGGAGNRGPRHTEREARAETPLVEPARFAQTDAEAQRGAKTQTNAEAQAPAIGGGARPEAVFDRFRAKMLERDRARFASLDGARLITIEGNTIRLGAPAAFHVERLRQRLEELEGLASEFFGQTTRISVEVDATPGPKQENTASRERSRKRRQDALNNEEVNIAIDVLDAEIVEIRPLGGAGSAMTLGEKR
jgi:DNA polymerase-3 subunit gamma/tau